MEACKQYKVVRIYQVHDYRLPGYHSYKSKCEIFLHLEQARGGVYVMSPFNCIDVLVSKVYLLMETFIG